MCCFFISDKSSSCRTYCAGLLLNLQIHHKCKCRSLFEGTFSMIWSYWLSWLGSEGTNQESGLRIFPDRFAYNNTCWHALTHTHMALTPAASFSSWLASWSQRLPRWSCSGRLGSTSAQRCPSGSKIFLPTFSIYPETSCWVDSFPSTFSQATSPRGRCRTTSAAKGKLMIQRSHWTLADAEQKYSFPFFVGHAVWTITDWVWPSWWSTPWTKSTRTKSCCQASSWVMKSTTPASSLLL